jgi:hypothetical protein
MKISKTTLEDLIKEEFDSQYSKSSKLQKRFEIQVGKLLDRIHSIGTRYADSLTSKFSGTRVKIDTRKTDYLRKLHDRAHSATVTWEGTIEKIDFDIEQMHDATEIVLFATVVLDEIHAQALGMNKIAVDTRGLSL